MESVKILAIDDSESMRKLVSLTLKQAGFAVVEACNGQDALEKSQKSDISLFLCDVNMPVMDGFTLVKRLRESSSYRFSPILMLTTESSREKKMEGKRAGATGWIVKPFDPDKLVATVKKVLPEQVV